MQSPAAGTPRALHQVSGLEARAGRDDDQKARDGLVYQIACLIDYMVAFDDLTQRPPRVRLAIENGSCTHSLRILPSERVQ
jgi:hypothetical protein